MSKVIGVKDVEIEVGIRAFLKQYPEVDDERVVNMYQGKLPNGEIREDVISGYSFAEKIRHSVHIKHIETGITIYVNSKKSQKISLAQGLEQLKIKLKEIG